jgi:hypothetical protein
LILVIGKYQEMPVMINLSAAATIQIVSVRVSRSDEIKYQVRVYSQYVSAEGDADWWALSDDADKETAIQTLNKYRNAIDNALNCGTNIIDLWGKTLPNGKVV